MNNRFLAAIKEYYLNAIRNSLSDADVTILVDCIKKIQTATYEPDIMNQYEELFGHIEEMICYNNIDVFGKTVYSNPISSIVYEYTKAELFSYILVEVMVRWNKFQQDYKENPNDE